MHVPAWPVHPDLVSAGDAFQARSLSGLGLIVCDETGSGECWDEPDANTTTLELPFDVSQIPATTSGTVINVPTSSGVRSYQNVGTQAAPNYVPMLTAVTQGAIDLAKLMAIQPGTVQQGGTTTRQTAGYAISTPTTSTGLNLTTGTGGGLIIAAGAVLVALMFMSGRKN